MVEYDPQELWQRGKANVLRCRSSLEPGGARLSACTLQLLDSSQGHVTGQPIGALWASSAGNLLVVASLAVAGRHS